MHGILDTMHGICILDTMHSIQDTMHSILDTMHKDTMQRCAFYYQMIAVHID